MKTPLFAVIAMLMIAGCAKPYYSAGRGGPLASVTYVRQDATHYIDENSGAPIPEAELSAFTGRWISTDNQRLFPTTIYLYKTEACNGAPDLMGRLDARRAATASKTVAVRAGVPLVNSFRTKFKTCQRECYKFFYSSSVFVPEQGGRYEVIVEPINGVTVYRLGEGGKKTLEASSVPAGACRY